MARKILTQAGPKMRHNAQTLCSFCPNRQNEQHLQSIQRHSSFWSLKFRFSTLPPFARKRMYWQCMQSHPKGGKVEKHNLRLKTGLRR